VTASIGGARTSGGGRRDEREMRELRRAVRDLGVRLTRLERWAHWTAGGMAAVTGTVIVNTIRSLMGDAS
jgi:hypothetical protein